MAAALELVVRVAAAAIVAIADGLADRQPLAQEPLVDHVRSHLVLEADHALERVGEAPFGLAPTRPCADEQTLVVVQGVDTVGVVVVAEVVAEVVPIDGAEGAPHLARVEDVSQPQHACVPGAEDLIADAALAILVGGIDALGHLLEVVLAVEEALVGESAA